MRLDPDRAGMIKSMKALLLAQAVLLICIMQASGANYVDICRNAGAGGYEGFPDICRLKDGRLMCAFYAGYGHASPGRKKLKEVEGIGDQWLRNNIGLSLAQVKKFTQKWPKGGRLVYCISSDEGRTWTKPVIMYDGPKDERDPSLVQLENGRLVCDFFCSFEANVYTIHSDDAGWGACGSP